MHPVIKLGNLSDQLKSQTYYGVCSDFTFDQDLCKLLFYFFLTFYFVVTFWFIQIYHFILILKKKF